MFYISDLPLIILQLYFRFIRGHSIVHAIITGQCVAQTVCNIWSCACERGYTQGWLERWILLPYVSWCFHHCWISAQFGFVYFYIGAFSTPYTFGIILRTPLRSWGFLFQFFCCLMFSRRRLRICPRILWPLPRELDHLSCPISSGLFTFVLVFLINWTHKNANCVLDYLHLSGVIDSLKISTIKKSTDKNPRKKLN